MNLSFLRFRRFSLFLCVFANSVVFALPAHAESLKEAVHSALKLHPSVEAAKAALDEARQRKREQFSGYFPEVTIAGQGGRMFADNSTTRGLVTTRGEAYSYLWEGNLTVRQKIFDGFETWNRVDAAGARKESAFNTLFEVRETLSLRAAQAYVNVLRARKGVDMIEEYAEKVADYLARIRSMAEEGAADESEVQRALDIQVILDGILADFKGQLISAESEYAEAVGHAPAQDLTRPSPKLDLIPGDIEAAVEYALDNHPSIAAAKMDSKAAGYEVGVEKSSLYPDLNGELSYLKNDRREEIGGETEDARAVLRLNWNFSTGGAQLARIQSSRFSYQEALARLQEVKRQIERDVRLAYSEYLTASRQLELLGKRKALNKKLFETYTAQFEGARVDLLQLMQASNQYFNTRLESMNGLYRLISAQYGVLANMGRLQDSMGLEHVLVNSEKERVLTDPGMPEKLPVIEVPKVPEKQPEELDEGFQEEKEASWQTDTSQHSFNAYKVFKKKRN